MFGCSPLVECPPSGFARFYEQLGYTNIKTQYSFAKSLHPAAHDELTGLVPRVDD